MRILVTGAAGFIGGAVATALRAHGHDVIGVDAYIVQAHGGNPAVRADVAPIDLRDEDSTRRVLRSVDVVCHQAAMVGAGLDAADLPRFAGNNDLGTATLLSAMASADVGRLVLASSMVVYGDGRYACSEHGERPPATRSVDDLRRGSFEVECPDCHQHMDWALVDEDAPLRPRSGYAASKVAQEHYASAWARQTSGAVLALRYHNVYGPGMPADTPYSGVAAIFRSALERGQAPRVFEDGGQMRDFVHVDDAVAANLRAVAVAGETGSGDLLAYNVCSGTPIAIAEVARLIAAGADKPGFEPVVTGEFRLGDVRHVVASPDRARRELGFDAQVAPGEGLRRFAHDPLRPKAFTRR